MYVCNTKNIFMINDILIYSGSFLTILWGIIHVIPNKKVMDAIGKKNWEMREIVLMEWILEGITLIFVGILVFLINYYGEGPNVACHIVFRSSAAMLASMATWTLITGTITSFKPLKICPFIKLIAGSLIFFGSYL